ncbi:MAG: hypothetical protein K5744_03950 [Eubacterium sp.]|nr:hypothetical protein [Eubacterium sp.]
MRGKKTITFLLISVLLCGCSSGKEDRKPAMSHPAGAEAEAEESQIPEELSYPGDTVLRMATGYNSPKAGMSFDEETAKGGVTLFDGSVYQPGDLKPTWAEVEKRLHFKIEDKYRGKNVEEELAYWRSRLDEVDLVVGNAPSLHALGEAGKLVDLSKYLDLMPSFRENLEEYDMVRLSVTGNTDMGSVYFAPYFDGIDDIERMPLMRSDWVQRLLDGDGAFAAESCGKTGEPHYEPYMPLSGKYDIDVVKPDGKSTETIVKNYDAFGNVIESMNQRGSMNGVEAVNLLRQYIDETYGGYYGAKRSDLFIGQNAAWDADELVALLRCIEANPQTLNGTEEVAGIFTREDANNQRRCDMFRLAGLLFGVRGLDSRQDYLYFGKTGKLIDARLQPETYQALGRMHDMVLEGLISESFRKGTSMTSAEMLERDMGFMHYDYNQTQTVYNRTKLQADAGEKYMPVLPPVAKWYDGTGSKIMRFTESWRSAKSFGWAISADGIADDRDKLCAALKLIDYAYSDEGVILMSYGPDACIRKKEDGSYAMFSYEGREIPEISPELYEEIWKKDGNFTDYARRYLGSTLGILKSHAVEYQCMEDAGKEGEANIENAVALGVVRHPELSQEENLWYSLIPTTFPLTRKEMDLLNIYPDMNDCFSPSKDGNNLLVDIIVNGFEGTADSEAKIAYKVNKEMGGGESLKIMQSAMDRLFLCYG